MKKMTKIVISILVVVVLIACNNTENESDLLSIGVIQFAHHEALDAVYDGLIDGLAELGLIENEHYTIDYNNAQGDIATAETIANKLANNNNDLIFAIATPATQAVANKTTDIPIIFGAVTDAKTAKLVIENDNPQTNVSGVSDLTPVKRQIELLKEIDPSVKNIAVMYANAEDNSRFQAQLAKTEIENQGMTFIDASVSESNQIQQMTQSIISKVDAIYVPTDNLISENFSLISDIAIENEVITVVGEIAMVKKGGLITDGFSYYNSGKTTAKMVYDILVDNQDVSMMPVQYLSDDQLQLAINETTMKQLNISLSNEILSNAIIEK